jgi:hypothetical protein
LEWRSLFDRPNHSRQSVANRYILRIRSFEHFDYSRWFDVDDATLSSGNGAMLYDTTNGHGSDAEC